MVARSCEAYRGWVIRIVLAGLLGCGGQSQGEVASGADAGDEDVVTKDVVEVGPTDTGSENDAPALVDPPENGPCVRVSVLPAPPDELPYGRMFFSGPGELWSVSGTNAPLDTMGGTLHWTETSGWERIEMQEGSLRILPFVGVSALATFDDAPAFGSTTKLPHVEDLSAWKSCSSWFLAESLGMPWVGNNGDCARTRLQAILLYPEGEKFRILTLGDHNVFPSITEVGTGNAYELDGWLNDQELWYLRYTAVGRWHIRSGRLTEVGVIDLDALQMKAVDGVPAIDGYGAVAVRDHLLWLYGADQTGAPVLARIDPASATATLFDATGLPRPGLPNVEQDLLAHDGVRLWKLRFDEGSAIVGTLDPDTLVALIHPMVGDVAAARSLFIPAQADLLEPDVRSYEQNGFRPPESLHVLPIGDGEIVVARQWGEFTAVRMSLACP